MRSGPDLSLTLEEVKSFLATGDKATLTTLDRDGMPHSATMYFCFSDDRIRMWTYRKSQKARNLSRDPRCAFLVEAGEPYVDVKGVLVRGRVELVEEADDVASIGKELYEKYFERKTGTPFDSGPDAEVTRQAPKRVGIVLPLEEIASWDHAKTGKRQR